MTPKEKAEELVNKMDLEYGTPAKQCALIAVDEIMEAISNVLPYGMQYLSEIDYYEEVKQEIEKL